MLNKPHKWGLKAWCLADSKTGYMYNLNMYTGKETVAVNETRGATHKLVMDVINPILDRGHIVYMDDYFSSPALFKDMIDRQTGACGTLRVNRTGVPASVKTAKIRANSPAQFVRDDNILYADSTWLTSTSCFVVSAEFARILAEVANVLDQDSLHTSVSARGFEGD